MLYILFGCLHDIFLCAFYGRKLIEGILDDEPLICENSGQVNERQMLLFYAQLIQKFVQVGSSKCATVVQQGSSIGVDACNVEIVVVIWLVIDFLLCK